ncbi:hypothetical protein G6F66_015683 [Rhizopus arrhizus]|nr:hypothetical protein G6F66_015683 [Rhizopus arrhizus]
MGPRRRPVSGTGTATAQPSAGCRRLPASYRRLRWRPVGRRSAAQTPRDAGLPAVRALAGECVRGRKPSWSRVGQRFG